MNLKFISSFGSKNYLNYLQLPLCHFFVFTFAVVELVRNRIAHAQKPDFFIRLNGLVHLNRRESQFSRMLAAEVCTSAVVMLIHHVPRSCESTGYPLHLPVSPSLPPQVRHRVTPHSERSIASTCTTTGTGGWFLGTRQ